MILSGSLDRPSAACVEDFHPDDVVAVVIHGGRSFYFARVIGPATKASSGPGGRVRLIRSDLLGRSPVGAVEECRVARNLILKARDGKPVSPAGL